MDFWSTVGTDIKQSEVRPLIEQNAPLEHIMEQPTFLDEFYSQHDYIIAYVTRPDILQQLVILVTMTKVGDPNLYLRACHLAFHAFMILAAQNPTIQVVLYERTELLAQFFAIGQKSSQEALTAQGYLYGAVRNWISLSNTSAESFIKVLIKHSDAFVLPLVHNPTAPNTAILKELLSSEQESLRKYKISIFDYIIYFFMNEKFEDDLLVKDEDAFRNIFDVFHFLGSENVIFEYKQAYVAKLFVVNNIKRPKFREELVTLRICILNYLAKIGQVTTCPLDSALLSEYANYPAGPKRTSFLQELLGFLKAVSNRLEFQEKLSAAFFVFLIELVKNMPRNDVIHCLVFSIFENCAAWLGTNEESLTTVGIFLLEIGKKSSLPSQEGKKSPANQISLNFVNRLLEKLNLDKIRNEQLKGELLKLKSACAQVFKRLFTDSGTDQSVVTGKSSVRFNLRNDFGLFGADATEDVDFTNSFEASLFVRNSPPQFDNSSQHSGSRLSGSLLSEGEAGPRSRLSTEGGGFQPHASNYANEEHLADQFMRKQSAPMGRDKVGDPFAVQPDPKFRSSNDFDPFKQFNG